MVGAEPTRLLILPNLRISVGHEVVTVVACPSELLARYTVTGAGESDSGQDGAGAKWCETMTNGTPDDGCSTRQDEQGYRDPIPDVETNRDENRNAELDPAGKASGQRLDQDEATSFSPPRIIRHKFPVEFGDYRLLRAIGQGGMGIVFEAEQKSLGNRRIAIKTIKYLGEINHGAVRRFENEVRAVAQLEHRNIVPVYHLGVEDGTHYYAMKLIDGKNLRELVKALKNAVSRQRRTTVQPGGTERGDVQGGNTPHESGWSKGDTLASSNVIERISATGSVALPQFVKNLVRMGIQVADALHHVHEHGIVHRDVKPANLILDADGDVWLTDFGLALISDNPALTAPGDLVGTYAYMSPEQAMGSKRVIFDHRSDIFSLGATLYELLTLRRAFPGRTREEILYAVQFKNPQPIRSIAPRMPKDLETIVMKALAKDPNARFQSAADMAAELRRFQEGKPLTVRPPNTLERIGYWARANRQLAASIAAVGLVTVIATIFSVFQSMRVQQAETESELKVQKVRQVETQKALAAETKQKNEVTRLLNQSEGLRLAANSSLQLDNDATVALLLGIEAAKRYPGADANDAIMNALDARYEARVLSGHSLPVGHVAFSHDGSKLISSATTQVFQLVNQAGDQHQDDEQADANKTPMIEPAIVWDPSAGNELGRLLDNYTITSAVFSPNDEWILTAASSDEVEAPNDVDEAKPPAPPRLWSALDYTPAVTFADALLSEAHPGSFHKDGSLLVLPTVANEAAIYSTAGVRIAELTGHAARVVHATFSPRGNRVATASADNTIRIWDLRIDDGKPSLEEHAPLEQWRKPSGTERPRDLTWLAFGPDGRMLFTGSSSREIEIWDLDHVDVSINTDTIPGRQGEIFANGSLLMTTGLADRSIVIRRAHDADWVENQRINLLARKVVVSPDNRVLGVLGYNDSQKFHLWDLERKTLRATLGANPGFAIVDLAFSPDSALIATACEDGGVRIHHVTSGRERSTYPAKRYDSIPLAVASPDGTMLAVASNEPSPVGEFCSPDLSQRLQLDARIILPLSQGVHLLAVQGKQLSVRSTNDARLVSKEMTLTYRVRHAAINSRGDRVAAYCGRKHVVLWFTDQNRLIRLPIGSEPLMQLWFSPATGNLLSIGLDGVVRVWNSETGRLVTTVAIGDKLQLADIEFSADASMYALATNRDTAILLDARTHREILRLQRANARFDRTRFAFDNSKLITYSSVSAPNSTSVQLWDLGSGELLEEFFVGGRVTVKTNPSKAEALLWSSTDGAFLWNYDTGERTEVTSDSAFAGAYSRDGEHFYLGTGGRANDLTVSSQPWSETANAPKLTRWARSGIERLESIEFPFESFGDIVIDAEGHVIVDGNRWNQVINYDVDTKAVEAIVPGHYGPITACLFTSDSERMITTSWDTSVSLWDASTGRQLGRWNDHRSPITSAAISRDDRILVTGARDGRVVIWDLVESTAETAVVRSFDALRESIRHIAIDRDARRILAISDEAECKLYDVESLQQIEVGLSDVRIEWAEFSADGKSLLAIPQKVEATVTPHVLVISLEEKAILKIEYPGTVRSSHFHPDSKRIATTYESMTNDEDDPRTNVVVSIVEVANRNVQHSFNHDQSSAYCAIFDPSGAYLIVSGQEQATVWRLSDGRRWMTMEDMPTGRHLTHHWKGAFISGRPARFVTRRRDTFQFRDYPLIPLTATERQAIRPLSKLEADHFHLSN